MKKIAFTMCKPNNNEHTKIKNLIMINIQKYKPNHNTITATLILVVLKVKEYSHIFLPKDCSYHYNDNLDTKVTAIVQKNNSIDGNVDLTIIGGNFTSENDSFIQIGDMGMVCQPYSVSTNEINCTIEKPEAGLYDVKVFVKSKGEATYPQNGLQVDVPLIVNGISPNTGSLGQLCAEIKQIEPPTSKEFLPMSLLGTF